MKNLSLIVVLFLSILSSNAQSGSHPAKYDEFVGPFPSWNIITSGGDSITDATDIIQSQLDKVGNDTSKVAVIYLSKGTYRITRSLQNNAKMSVSFIGEDPATTRIIWDGAEGGSMMEMNGIAYSSVNRITWDGKGRARVGIDQSWDGNAGFFDTGNEFADDNFVNLGIGIYGGHKGYGFAETTIMRCKFIRNTVTGISLGNWNALDIWIWNCLFQDCAKGVTNELGAGNFRVYSCVFKNSYSADIWLGNTGGFSIRDNYSEGSRQFFGAAFTGNPSTVVIQGNTIVDPTSNEVLSIANQGPITLLDNTFRLKDGVNVPVIKHYAWPSGNFFSMGNKFTSENPYQLNYNIKCGDQIVQRSSLMNLQQPVLPPTPVNYHRTIFEVPASSTSETIQSIIDEATIKGGRSVVHFPYSLFYIDKPLSITAGSDVQLIGDAYGDRKASTLIWMGQTGGTMLNIAGPTKVSIKDLTLNGNSTSDGIVVTNIDQPSSRVFTDQLHVGGSENNLFVDGLDYTKVLLYNSDFKHARNKAITVTGGVAAAAGQSKGGKTIIYGGAQSENKISHDVSNGGDLLIRDVWYESNSVGCFLKAENSGKVTVDGTFTFTPKSETTPQFYVKNFEGNLTFLGTSIKENVVVTGDGSKSNILGINNALGNKEYLFDNTTQKATIRSVSNRVLDPQNIVSSSGSYAADDIGTVDDAYLVKMMEQTRSVKSEELTSLPENVTDLRFHRVTITGANYGLQLKGSVATALPLNFTYFNGVCNSGKSKLSWKTSVDDKVESFEIERSENGTVYNRVGSISSNITGSYQYIDINSGGYYRIAAVNHGGSKIYSRVVKIDCSVTNILSAYPNPVSTELTLSLSSLTNSEAAISIIDAKGATVKRMQSRIVTGNNLLRINVQDLARGVYNVVATWNSQTKTIQIIK